MAKIVQAVSVGKRLCRIGIQVSREVTEESGSAGAAETSLRTKLPRFLNRTPTPLLPPIPYVALSPTTDVQLFPFVTLLLTSGVADSWVSIVGRMPSEDGRGVRGPSGGELPTGSKPAEECSLGEGQWADELRRRGQRAV